MTEDDNKIKKDNLSRQGGDSWYKPVLIFYAKTTSWIIFPLLVGFFIARYFGKSIGSQTLFFIIIMISFIVTVYGIYREIKQYKNTLK